MSDHDATTVPGDRIIRGVDAIASFLGEPKRRVNYMLVKKQIPAGRLGRCWYASERVLREHIERVVTGGAA